MRPIGYMVVRKHRQDFEAASDIYESFADAQTIFAARRLEDEQMPYDIAQLAIQTPPPEVDVDE